MIGGSERYILLASDSTHYIMKVESLFKELNIPCRIIPLPSQLKASCGLSVRALESDLSKIKEIVTKENLEVEPYLMTQVGLKKSFEKLEF